MLADCLKRQSKLSQSLFWYKKALDNCYQEEYRNAFAGQDFDTDQSAARTDMAAISKEYRETLKQLGRSKELQLAEEKIDGMWKSLKPQPAAPISQYYPPVDHGYKDAFVE